jgi:hypothetical protein
VVDAEQWLAELLARDDGNGDAVSRCVRIHG